MRRSKDCTANLGRRFPCALTRTRLDGWIPRFAWAGNWPRNWDGEGTWRTLTASIDGMASPPPPPARRGSKRPSPSGDCCSHLFRGYSESVSKDAVQIILCDHHYWGGMRQVQMLPTYARPWPGPVHALEQSPRGFLDGDGPRAAATPHLSYACDTHYPWQTEKTKWFSEAARSWTGVLKSPIGPDWA